MSIRRKFTAGIVTAGVLVGGVLMATPANASGIYQNGCVGNSFKIYTNTVGYCFNGAGTTRVNIDNVNSVYTGGNWGAFSYQAYNIGLSNQLFNYGQTYGYGEWFTVVNLRMNVN